MGLPIREDDFVASVSDALQFISCYHPPDYIAALHEAYLHEQSAAARDAIAQILTNSRMCSEGRRPICQDTGIVVAFLKIGMHVQWDASLTVDQMVNEGVRRAFSDTSNPLRASIVSDPLGGRTNTRDNTPAVVHVEMVAGDCVEVRLAAKGAGSENKAQFAVLNPSDSIADWVVDAVERMGAGWCPPGMLGIGVGGTAEKAMLLAKESLLDTIDMHELKRRGPSNRRDELRIEIYRRVNELGIGALGLGGLTTVLDVKILDHPTHAASQPVAVIPNCAATRHAHFVLDGSGPARFTAPPPDSWPDVTWTPSTTARRVDLGTVTRDKVSSWKAGEMLLLSGTILTARDAAHKRIADALAAGTGLPADVPFANRFVYYVGPVDAVGDEAVGPAGPTTASRMDRYMDQMLGATGILGTIGKAERGPGAVDAIRRHKAVYLIAVGGAAYLVSKAIPNARVVAFADLGMEAIREFEVEHMPVTVAVDSTGASVHQSGPADWRGRIAEAKLHRRVQG